MVRGFPPRSRRSGVVPDRAGIRLGPLSERIRIDACWWSAGHRQVRQTACLHAPSTQGQAVSLRAMSSGAIAASLSFVGAAQAVLGWRLTARFASRTREPPGSMPPITVLKPLHGDEPWLEEALSSVCRQDYPRWQVVFGVQRADDPAIAVVNRLRTRFPACDISLIVDPTIHGPNRKVGNLINMLPAAHHNVLVIADSDLHVRPDYLRHLASALSAPDIGLVTTLYRGLPAFPRLSNRLGATQITHGFLPSALLARAIGRQDCLGATMCLSRDTLTRIGGFGALVNHLADDNVLGQLVRRLNLRVALAGAVVATTVPETGLAALLRHELRWARTIRALAPAGFAASVLQYPLFWALLAVVLSPNAWWSWGTLALTWAARAAAGRGIDRALAQPALRLGLMPSNPGQQACGSAEAEPALAFRCPIWLLPLRDIMSVMIMVASYAGRRVDWRGHMMRADSPDLPATPSTAQPRE